MRRSQRRGKLLRNEASLTLSIKPSQTHAKSYDAQISLSLLCVLNPWLHFFFQNLKIDECAFFSGMLFLTSLVFLRSHLNTLICLLLNEERK
ncbi:hypothetical protein PRUPE_2G179000 [Prunus persica]|uniref:Uncharacterized protein n=1 Tax=Prunus persica TaxID=3760 RepID=A0A251QHJ9_PRUPE|nr:hypothetical protein PRUPE_2G179000 [Prunus persica]